MSWQPPGGPPPDPWQQRPQGSGGGDERPVFVPPPAPVFVPQAGPDPLPGWPLASFARRAAGWIIDACGVAAFATGAGAIVAAAGYSSDTGVAVALLTGLLLWVLNAVVLVGITHGRSVGRLVCGMRLIRDDGTAAGASVGFVRDVLLRMLYVFGPFFLVDSLFALSRERQTLRDKMAGTYVIADSLSVGRRVAAATAAVLAFFGLGGTLDALPDSWLEESSSPTGFVAICAEANALTHRTCRCIGDHLSPSARESFLYDEESPPKLDAQIEDALDRCLPGSGPDFGSERRKS